MHYTTHQQMLPPDLHKAGLEAAHLSHVCKLHFVVHTPEAHTIVRWAHEVQLNKQTSLIYMKTLLTT